MAFAIAFIMVTSVIGFMWGREGEQRREKYNGRTFILNENGQWVTKINKVSFSFNYFPKDLEDIKINEDIKGKLLNTYEIDTTYDINDSHKEAIAITQYEMNQDLSKVNVYIRNGLTSDNNFTIPIIDCNSATFNIPIIYFKSSNETKISLERNCIIAEAANQREFSRIKDRLIYTIFGVIA